jgi:hypothetical protein
MARNAFRYYYDNARDWQGDVYKVDDSFVRDYIQNGQKAGTYTCKFRLTGGFFSSSSGQEYMWSYSP